MPWNGVLKELHMIDNRISTNLLVLQFYISQLVRFVHFFRYIQVFQFYLHPYILLDKMEQLKLLARMYNPKWVNYYKNIYIIKDCIYTYIYNIINIIFFSISHIIRKHYYYIFQYKFSRSTKLQKTYIIMPRILCNTFFFYPFFELFQT